MLYPEELFRKTIFISLLIAILVVFILSYSLFFVDKKISSLYFILNKLKTVKTIDEKKYIKPFLTNLILKEISERQPDELYILSLQTALDILHNIKDKKQFEDIAFFLSDALRLKEQKRAKLFLKLDKIIIWLLGSEFRIKPEKGYKIKPKELLEKIKATKDIKEKQRYLYELVDIYISKDDISSAIDTLKEVINLDSHGIYSLRAEYKLALLYKLTGEIESAEELFKKISQEGIDYKFSLYSKYLLGSIYEYKEAFSNAKNLYDSLKLSLTDAYLIELSTFKEGYIYLYSHKDYKSSLDIYENMVLKFPQDNLMKHINTILIPRIGTYYRDLGFDLLIQKKY
ncbi:MAG: hypothetical protein NC909_01310 [Candidatus Omnitrophica bacterium]|nr:hypothetical protein [Candidatus Omnitrophota bacterium]